MASATVETQATDETASKRKRVDVEAVAASDPQAKILMNLPVPAEMRVKIREAAEASNVSEFQYIRDIVARELNYTVPASFNERKTRAGQYAGMTDEEKKEAIAKANAAKREQVNSLLAKIASGEVDPALLEQLGIDVSALPKPRAAKNGSDSE